MINVIVLVLLVLPTFTHSANIYDNSINNLVFERSTFYYKNQGGDYNFFLEQVPTDKKIFVHLHGCGGLYYGDYIIQEQYLILDSAVISINFLSREGVGSSCPEGKHGNTSETSNSTRLAIRRKEAEVLVKDLQAKGYSNIYISGHSEGGRVASTWTVPVKGVVIHGMDCKLPGFWNIQKGQKTLVMFNWKDEWLVAQRSIQGCRHFFNKGWVTESTTDHSSHIPFQHPIHIKSFQDWISNILDEDILKKIMTQ